MIGVPPAANLRVRDPASVEQRSELRELLKTRAVDPAWRKQLYDRVRAAGDLTNEVAADALFYTRSLAPAGQRPSEAIGVQVDALQQLIRARMVPGPLAAVFRRRAESGDLTYIEADRWIREWMRLPFKAFTVASDLPRRSGWSAPDGYFALMHTDGFPRCYRVHTLPASNRKIVEQIFGDRRTQRRKIAGYQATEALRAIAAEPAGAAKLYARTRKHCARCNQPLEDHCGDPAWDAGYGRDCWDILNAAPESETNA